MTNIPSPINPLELWSNAASSMVETSLAMASTASTAAFSAWTAAAAGRVETPPVPAPRLSPLSRGLSREMDLLQPVEPLVGSTSSMSSRDNDRESAPKSWYKAPYRSPFDPMFWMQPFGQGADHLPLVMSLWLPNSGAAATAAPAAMMMNTPLAAAMPAAFQMWQSVIAAAMKGDSPWTAMVAAMTPGGKIGAGSAAQAMAAMTPIPDFADPFSAYRSAGGHAVAQIMVKAMTGASPFQPGGMMDFPSMPWLRR